MARNSPCWLTGNLLPKYGEADGARGILFKGFNLFVDPLLLFVHGLHFALKLFYSPHRGSHRGLHATLRGKGRLNRRCHVSRLLAQFCHGCFER